MRIPITVSEIAKILKSTSLSHKKVSKIGIDSREVIENELFFAIKGERVDPHGKLQEVARRGAVAACVDSQYQGPDYGMEIIRLDNVLKALQVLARSLLLRVNPQVIAITGSVGKTTTKCFISSLLKNSKETFSSPRNYNSQIGLPLGIVNGLGLETQLHIQEMAMTHPGQIANLVSICPPEIAVITTVDLVHAENFNSLDEIIQAKGEILTHPRTRLGIIPYHLLNKFDCKCPLFSFSTTNKKADLYLQRKEDGIYVNYKEKTYRCEHPPYSEEHLDNNLAAAFAVGFNLGGEWEEFSKKLSHLSLPEKRLQHIRKNEVDFINDTYNASAVSVKAALVSVSKQKRRRIGVLGTMPELGKFSEDCHREVGQVALDSVDHLFCLGEETLPMVEVWKKHHKPVRWFTNLDELRSELNNFLISGDLVLVKGANRLKMWEIVERFGSHV